MPFAPIFQFFALFFCFNNALVLSSFTFFSFLETPKTKQEKILSSVVCVAACVMCSALLCLGVDNQIHSTSVYLKPFRVESQRTNFFKTKLNREQFGLKVLYLRGFISSHRFISFTSHEHIVGSRRRQVIRIWFAKSMMSRWNSGIATGAHRGRRDEFRWNRSEWIKSSSGGDCSWR